MRTPRLTIVTLSLGMFVAASSGCALKRVEARSASVPKQQLSASGFRAFATSERTAADAPAATSDPVLQAAATPANEPIETQDTRAVATPGAPGESEVDYVVARSGRRIVVDQVVGQINGEPVYAEEFLEPMDAFLRARAEELRGSRPNWEQQWIDVASGVISERLQDQMRDQLLLADLQASLSEREKVGLLAFIESVRRDIRLEQGGARRLAEQRILATEGLDFDEFAQDRVDTALVAEQLNRQVNNKIRISWRDIERYYDQNTEEFMIPQAVSMRIINVLPGRRSEAQFEALQQEIQQKLDSGVPFEEVAAEYSSYAPDDRNLRVQRIEPDSSFEETTFFREPLQSAVTSLKPGEVAGPIELGSSVWWIRLEELVGGGTIDLYTAQLGIERRLRNREFAVAQGEFFERQIGETGIRDFAKMGEALLEYAFNKYVASQG